MQLNDILQKLKGVKSCVQNRGAGREGHGNQYTALCPAHDDKTPSLAISEKDGKILLHCHAGCTKESIVAAMGLEMKDLFIDVPLTARNIEERPTLGFRTLVRIKLDNKVCGFIAYFFGVMLKTQPKVILVLDFAKWCCKCVKFVNLEVMAVFFN